MKKFIFLYLGPFGANGAESSTPPLTRATLDQWAQRLGTSLVDSGTLLGPNGHSVTSTGVAKTPFPFHGYSVIQAENIDAAVLLTQGHPFLAGGRKGMYEIEVLEMLPGDIPADAFIPNINQAAFLSLPSTTNTTVMSPNVLSQTQSNTPIPASPTPTVPRSTAVPPPDIPPSAPGELNISHDEPQNDQPAGPLPPAVGVGS